MFASDAFRKKALKRIAVTKKETGEEGVALVRPVFDEFLPELPETQLDDLFGYLAFKYERDLDGMLDTICGIIDLFQMQYDPATETLDAEDLGVVREVLSASAGELDMRIVTSIMSFLVEKGLLS